MGLIAWDETTASAARRNGQFRRVRRNSHRATTLPFRPPRNIISRRHGSIQHRPSKRHGPFHPATVAAGAETEAEVVVVVAEAAGAKPGRNAHASHPALA